MTAAAELAACLGTPLFIYDLDRVAAARRSLFAALPAEFELFYALKANPHPDLARAMREGPGRSCRAEISSPGELAAALTAGFTAAECLYTGPGKTNEELDEAIGRGVRMFCVESLTDMQHVGTAARRHAAVAECLLRVNSAAARVPTGMRMMGRPSQFGIDSESLPGLMPRLAGVRGTRIVGAHFYTMSNAEDEACLIREFGQAIELAARLEGDVGVPLEFLDIGGGFAAPYAVPGEPARYDKLRPELERLLDFHLPRWRAGTPRLACESGRYLVGSSGLLLCGVVNVKDSRGRKFVILNAGINVVGGLSGLGRLLPMAVGLDAAQQTEVASLVGPLCTPGDVLGSQIRVPPLKIGDIVTIPNVGAYGLTASLMSFLSRRAPAEVTVRAGAVVSVSRLGFHRAHQPVGVAAGERR